MSYTTKPTRGHWPQKPESLRLSANSLAGRLDSVAIGRTVRLRASVGLALLEESLNIAHHRQTAEVPLVGPSILDGPIVGDVWIYWLSVG